jgi:hypothetical protein
MEQVASQNSVGRIFAAVLFFFAGTWLTYFTTDHLWVLYSPFYHGLRGSFGFIFNFGLFRLSEPWSSCFVLCCAASFFWAGCSLLRRPGGLRLGAMVGAVCFVVFLIGFVAAA